MFHIGARHDGYSSTPRKLRQSGSDLRQPSTSWRRKIAHWLSATIRQSTQQTSYMTSVFFWTPSYQWSSTSPKLRPPASIISVVCVKYDVLDRRSPLVLCWPWSRHDLITVTRCWRVYHSLHLNHYRRSKQCSTPHLQLESPWSHLVMSHTTSLVTSTSSCTV